ncbi:DegV family protein [uncultured Helcococcus sp.]|uniref:DegV family protein n=1 Tax=uncultured Helcococcus sp. TaxID=1072508 RepID=UPI0026019778|nr:DegV family protein [uncultured Helcococcus sp.]
MIQIVTDSASDITQDEARELNIHVVPLKIEFSDGEFPNNSLEDYQKFFKKLEESKDLPKTSSPSPALYLDIYNKAKEDSDQVIVISLSSGLSGTYESSLLAKNMIDYEDIFVIDSCQAIPAQRLLVEHAVKMRDQGYTAEEIVNEIESLKHKVSVSGLLDTLTYLAKGGRIPKSIELIGNALSIKPSIILEDKILQSLKLSRGRKSGKKALWKNFEKDFDPSYPVIFAYTSNEELGKGFMEETKEKYGLTDTKLVAIGGVIGTHVGGNGISIAYVKKD